MLAVGQTEGDFLASVQISNGNGVREDASTASRSGKAGVALNHDLTGAAWIGVEECGGLTDLASVFGPDWFGTAAGEHQERDENESEAHVSTFEPRLTEKSKREMEEALALKREAVHILNLVVAEWNSDPMSVQCFDLRIVERAKHVVLRLAELDRGLG